MANVNATESVFKIDPNLVDQVKVWRERVDQWRRDWIDDVVKRKQINALRRDFFEGNQSAYTNVIGETTAEKKGHSNAVYNIIKRFLLRIQNSITNNPPSQIIPPTRKNDVVEAMKAQATEDFVNQVYWDNMFYDTSYVRAVQNQTNYALFAIYCYPDFQAGKIVLENIEKIDNLIIGWRGDNVNYDYTIYEEMRSTFSLEEEFGVKADAWMDGLNDASPLDHDHPYGYNGVSGSSINRQRLYDEGVVNAPMAKFTDVWTNRYNIVLINDEVVQLVEHGWGFNPNVVGGNIPNVGKRNGISDIDDLIDPQIEYNQLKNDDRDFIRTAVNRKYRAHNMDDFDPESLRTGSGQVIFTNNEEEFEAISDPVNTFPIDTAISNTQSFMHLIGIPEQVLGAGITSGLSGKAMAIGFHPYGEMIMQKQKAWKVVFMELNKRIQYFGWKYFAPKQKADNFFLNSNGDFEVRPVELKWEDSMPATREDKQVGIINKKNTRMISLRTALEEMGYTDPEAEIERLKQEWNDPILAPILANKTEMLEGIIKAAVKAQIEQREALGGGEGGEEEPVLNQSQNQNFKMPMAQPGMSMRAASPAGRVANVIQNQQAQR